MEKTAINDQTDNGLNEPNVRNSNNERVDDAGDHTRFLVCFTVYGHKNSNERKVMQEADREFDTYDEAVEYAKSVDKTTAYIVMEEMTDRNAVRNGDLSSLAEGLSANIYEIRDSKLKLIDFCEISRWQFNNPLNE